jgi:hypothetical protein
VPALLHSVARSVSFRFLFAQWSQIVAPTPRVVNRILNQQKCGLHRYLGNGLATPALSVS